MLANVPSKPTKEKYFFEASFGSDSGNSSLVDIVAYKRKIDIHPKLSIAFFSINIYINRHNVCTGKLKYFAKGG
mgnify:CR=1 FL=1